MEWSPQQESAIKSVRAWARGHGRPQVCKLFGFAGTGKTTLAVHLAQDVRGRVLFGAFTGKAALVMRRKGCTDARTIHSLIYQLDDDDGGREPKFVLSPYSDVRGAALVVIDECSMVDETLARDLLSFGTKVLVLGDPAQLPPVKGSGFFTVGEPDIMLTEVHRQARDNPIIRMSMTIREGGHLEIGDYGSSRVISKADVSSELVLGASQILVGLNRTRHSYNRRLRELKGRTSPLPVEGDKLVCLRNDRDKKLLNGGLWLTQKASKKPSPKTNSLTLQVVPEDEAAEKHTSVRVRAEFFTGDEANVPWEDLRGTQQFTYGYALTVHKSQGSQWNDVVVFDESSAFREDRARHLYTAVTRAAERVTVVI